jgi:hypothetical protein
MPAKKKVFFLKVFLLVEPTEGTFISVFKDKLLKSSVADPDPGYGALLTLYPGT